MLTRKCIKPFIYCSIAKLEPGYFAGAGNLTSERIRLEPEGLGIFFDKQVLMVRIGAASNCTAPQQWYRGQGVYGDQEKKLIDTGKESIWIHLYLNTGSSILLAMNRGAPHHWGRCFRISAAVSQHSGNRKNSQVTAYRHLFFMEYKICPFITNPLRVPRAVVNNVA